MDLNTQVESIRADLPSRWNISCYSEFKGLDFPHLVIDNFFTDDEFATIMAHKANVSGKEIKIAHSLVRKDGSTKSDTFSGDFLTNIDHQYRPVMLKLLGIMAEKKAPLYELADFHLITTGPDYEHPIHDDIPKKLLSIVIYMSPEKSNGTFIYDSREATSPVGEIEWKRNRAFVFSRKDRKTWHAYSADNISDRFCVVYNLNTYKAYKAHWAEGNFLKYLEKRIKNE